MFRRPASSTKHVLSALIGVAALLLAPACDAQLNVEVPVVLNGPDVANRQVTGLELPLETGDAVSLSAARIGAVNTVVLSGSTELIGELTPAPSSYSIGMTLTVMPSSSTANGATLDLNGLGPKPIVRIGGVPVTAHDLRPGVPARLVYDGIHFQLLSSTGLPCPVGYAAASQRYCIADQPLPAATFFDAITTCAEQGARLCTISEWSHACRSIPTFFATVTEAEWVDHAANNNTGAKLVGFGIDGGEGGLGSGCEFGGQVVPTTPYRYRCCSNR